MDDEEGEEGFPNVNNDLSYARISELAGSLTVSNNQLFQSALTDKSSTFRNAISEQVGTSLLKVLKSSEGRKTVVVRFDLTIDENFKLQESFPEFDIRIENASTHAHAFSAAHRHLEYNRLLNRISYNRLNGLLYGSDVQVLDIGGDYAKNLISGNLGIHADCPLIDARDHARETVRQLRVRDYFSSTSFARESIQLKFLEQHNSVISGSAGCRFYCHNVFEDCKVTADKAIMLHSCYDIDFNRFASAMTKRGVKLVYGSFNFCADILYKAKGQQQDSSYTWSVDLVNDKIKFGFMNDSSFMYTHDLTNYLKWATQTVMRDEENGLVYLKELMENVNGVQFYRISYAGPVSGGSITNAIYFPSMVDKVLVKVFDFDFDSVAEEKFRLMCSTDANLPDVNNCAIYDPDQFIRGLSNDQGLKYRNILVNKNFLNELLLFVLGANETKFVPLEVFNMARSLIMRIVVGKEVVRAYKVIEARELFMLSQTIYILCYALKYAQGKVTQHLKGSVDYDRRLYHSNWFTKLVRCIPFMSSKPEIIPHRNFLVGWLHRAVYKYRRSAFPVGELLREGLNAIELTSEVFHIRGTKVTSLPLGNVEYTDLLLGRVVPSAPLLEDLEDDVNTLYKYYDQISLFDDGIYRACVVNYKNVNKPVDGKNNSYLKLQEIDSKFDVFTNMSAQAVVLDVSVAPGGFVKYCNDMGIFVDGNVFTGAKGALDLYTGIRFNDVTTGNGDLCNPTALAGFRRGYYDLVLCDASVAVDGRGESKNYALISAEIETVHFTIRKGGSAILKFFIPRSDNMRKLIEGFAGCFSSCDVYRCTNTSKISAELYLIGRDYRWKGFTVCGFSSVFDSHYSMLEYNLLCFLRDLQEYERNDRLINEVLSGESVGLADLSFVSCNNFDSKVAPEVWYLDGIIGEDFFSDDCVEAESTVLTLDPDVVDRTDLQEVNTIVEVSSSSEISYEGELFVESGTDVSVVGVGEPSVSEPDGLVTDKSAGSIINIGNGRTLTVGDFGCDFQLFVTQGDGHCFFNCLAGNGNGWALRNCMKSSEAPMELNSDEYVGEDTFLYVVQRYNVAIYVHIVSDDYEYVTLNSYSNKQYVNQVFHIMYRAAHYDLLKPVCRNCSGIVDGGGFIYEGLNVDCCVGYCKCFVYSVPMVVPRNVFDVNALNEYLVRSGIKVDVYFSNNHVFVVEGSVEYVSAIDFSNHICTTVPSVGYRQLVKGVYVNCCAKNVEIVRGYKDGAPVFNFTSVKQPQVHDGFSVSIENNVYKICVIDKTKLMVWLRSVVCEFDVINIKSDCMLDFSWFIECAGVDKVYMDVNIQRKYFSYSGIGCFKQAVRSAITEQLLDWKMTRDKIEKELCSKVNNTVSTLTSGSIHNYADIFSDVSLGVLVCTRISGNWRSEFRVSPVSLHDSYAMGYVTDGRRFYGLQSLVIKFLDNGKIGRFIVVEGLDKLNLQSSSVYVYFNKDCRMDNSMLLYKSVVNLVTCPVGFSLKVFEGAPGIGKTHLMLSQHNWQEDIILTATKMGADELRRRSLVANSDRGLTEEIARNRYMTIDSFLINGNSSCKTLYIDEALMVHAGSWLAAGIKSNCSKVVIIGDSAQIPYIDRNGFGCKLFHYSCLGDVEVVTKLCSYRIPCDVAFFINTLRKDGKCMYSGKVTTHNSVKRSLSTQMLDQSTLGGLCNGKTVLTFSQADKAELIRRGIKANTVGESQGSQYDDIVLVRLNTKELPLYADKHQWLVALSRHKKSFVYLTSVEDNLTKQINTVNSCCDSEVEDCFDMKGGAISQFPSYNVVVNPPVMKNPLSYPRVIRDFVCTHNSTGLRSIFPELLNAELDNPVECPFIPIFKVNDPLNVLQFYVDKIRPGSSCEYQRYDQYNYNYRDQYYPSFECARFAMPGVPKMKDYLTPELRVTCPVATLHNDRSVVKAFAERNGGVPEYTTQTRDEDLADELIQTFVANCIHDRLLLDSYRDNPIELNSSSVQQWLYTQPVGTDEFLHDEEYYNIFFRELNKYNYILKKVPKPDLEPNGHLKFPAPQAIAHQSKQVNAYFCSMLRECKSRLLAVLNPNIIVNSDMAPSELVELLNYRMPSKTYKGFKNNFFGKQFWQRFLELDISKYDKSQQRVTLLAEVKFFMLMGMSYLFIILWLYMHVFTCLSDLFTKFKAFVVYQRKSGDAWTFSGNTIFLLLILVYVLNVHFYVDISKLVILIAGDDSIVFLGESVEVDKSKFYVLFGNLFNLEAKVMDYHVPYFCSKFLLPTEFGWVVIPDLWKLLIKLGRKDLVSFEHLKEYQISLKDIIEPLRNYCFSPYISEAMSDRYKLNISSDMLVGALVTYIDDTMLSNYYIHDNDVLGYYSTLPSLEI